MVATFCNYGNPKPHPLPPTTHPVLHDRPSLFEQAVEYHTGTIGGVGLVVQETIHQSTRQVPQVSISSLLAEDLQLSNDQTTQTIRQRLQATTQVAMEH